MKYVNYKTTVEQLFNTLTDNDKLCITLFYDSKLSINDIAEILVIDSKMVQNIILKVQKLLTQILEINFKLDEFDKELYDYFSLSQEVNNSNSTFNTDSKLDKILYNYFENTDKKETVTKKKFIIKTNPLFQSVASLVIVLLLSTSIVFGKDIISFFARIFDMSSINIPNTSIVDAIEENQYIQNIDMDYITIDDNYKIKVDYVMLDDFTLYIVFNLHSKITFDDMTEMQALDLNITDNFENCLYTHQAINPTTYFSSAGWKQLEKTDNEIKQLFFLTSNGFSKIKSININFSKIILYPKNNVKLQKEIEHDCNFNINLIEKFTNRESIEYITEYNVNPNIIIEKSVVAETGLYLLFKASDPSTNFEFLNKNASSYRSFIGYIDGFHYILQHYNIPKTSLENYNKLNFKLNNFKITFSKKNESK